MKNPRMYGKAPFLAAVIHGGPGAPGEMAPVALELSSMGGILEPLQTTRTVAGQIEELNEIMTKHGDLPMTLVGWSWGAWLSYLFASQNPESVKKLILISSGPFEEKDAQNIMNTRLKRLSGKGRAEVLILINALEEPGTKNKDDALMNLGKLISAADSFDPVPHKSFVRECRYDIYKSIWEQAVKLRRDGRLLERGKQIRCPVVAIHGDFDPHPAAGVKNPLARVLKDFRFVLLEKCGHMPWIESSAKDKFYKILRKELI
jgi:pimeloyl-ACP methyl ester carboxylesterase